MLREIDRMIRKAGGVMVGVGRHRHYELDGERLLVHMGSKVRSSTEKHIRSKIQKILKRRESA